MPRSIIVFLFALALSPSELPHSLWPTLLGQKAQAASPEARPYFAEPAISPDGSEIAFVSASDIWTVSASGGEARLLISHPAVEARPIYSPDGRQLAFASTRTGNGDIYVLTFETGELKRITFDDGYDHLNAWSRDGSWIYFSSSTNDIGSMQDVFRVRAGGGTPMQVSADRYTNEYFCAPSPDGRSLAITARGVVSSQWWRKGHSHVDESEVWLMHDGSPASYERLTGGGAKELWPMWSANGRSIFFISDRSGNENIWSRALQGEAKQVTQFKEGRVLWPTISYDGRFIVFERDFGIWKLNTGNGQLSKVNITRRGAFANPSVEHLTYTSQIRELQLSPDGKKIAFIVRGEVFAASAKDGGDGVRVTATSASESQVSWSPDSNRIAYVSDREGPPHLYLYDFRTGGEMRLTNGASEYAPRFSPDGEMIAFVSDAGEVRVIDLNSKQERVLAKANIGRPPYLSERLLAWSPDSKWLAFLAVSDKLFKNVHLVPVKGGQSQPISFLANYGSRALSWSSDGAFILFATGQRTENGQLARIDLRPRTPRFNEDQFRDLFKDDPPKATRPDAAKGEARTSGSELQSESQAGVPAALPAREKKAMASKQVEVIFDAIRQRLSLLAAGLDVEFQAISPDAKSTVVTANAAGQQNLYLYPLSTQSREAAVAKQITSTSGFKESVQFSPDGKEVYYLENGRVNVVTLETRQARSLSVTAELDVDFEQEKLQVFKQAWAYLRDHFFDQRYNGVDWEAVRDLYAPYIAGARTPDELRRLILLMIGELNASHLGLTSSQAVTSTVGRLGLQFDRAEYETRGVLRVSEVIPSGPAALASDVKPGDYLLAVDGRAIDSRANLDELLRYKINRKVSLTIAESAEGLNKRVLAVQPSNGATEKALRYAKWVEDNRDYVARLSGGRLGYIHMYDMSTESLAKLSVDLDSTNHSREGVIVDIRNNVGGFVNVQAIDVFARRGYLTMTPRGLTSAPARTILGQRALESPTILLVNRHSISDAEEFAEGYRALKLGKVVGEPTAGWVIYTSGVQLIDGSFLRIPNTRVTTNDGSTLEMNPRPVDVQVVRPVGESYTNHDTQLDAAIRELLKQIGNREKGAHP